jgi:FdhD protein
MVHSTHSPAITRLPVQEINAGNLKKTQDLVAVEEPLEIRLIFGPKEKRIEQSISVTMRTPGQDGELAAGFLFTEGIIHSQPAILSIEHEQRQEQKMVPGQDIAPDNIIRISLDEHIPLDLTRLQRHFYTSSSCGVCGKSSIDALRTVCPSPGPEKDWQIHSELIYSLPELLRHKQEIFEQTGGLHASALFDGKGNLLQVREDIGRHNALDKLIGHALSNDLLPLHKHILLLSGRACFELIQKAAMAGIRLIAAVGPPSSLAVQLAEEYGITLVGFLRDRRFNIYAGAHRISLS